MALHRQTALGDRHGIENWQYADAAARTGSSGFTSDDVGKLAYQLDTASYYRLTATTPTWSVLAGVSSGDLDAAIGKLEQNAQSADYTVALADAGKHVFHPSADTTARTFTVPANASVAFPVGTVLTFVNQDGAGTITISITSDTMRLAGAGTTGDRTLAENGIATAIKVAATEWLISGAGLS